MALKERFVTNVGAPWFGDGIYKDTLASGTPKANLVVTSFASMTMAEQLKTLQCPWARYGCTEGFFAHRAGTCEQHAARLCESRGVRGSGVPRSLLEIAQREVWGSDPADGSAVDEPNDGGALERELQSEVARLGRLAAAVDSHGSAGTTAGITRSPHWTPSSTRGSPTASAPLEAIAVKAASVISRTQRGVSSSCSARCLSHIL